MSSRPIISIKPYNPDWYPPCFESKEQHNDYMHMIRRVGQPMDSNNYCLDCTHEYKIQMMKENRCEHHETIFVQWRTTYKTPNTEGKITTTQDKPDVVGISNISQFWNSPLYD